jgi:DNA-binding NarL/FixJ family response regulator
VRVAIADDSTLFRGGLVALMTGAGVNVVIEARSGAELLALIQRNGAPQVAVLDIRMPPTFTDEGLTTALQIRQQHPTVGVLVLSTYAETDFAATLVESCNGSVGYLLKDRVDDLPSLLDALDRIASGETVIDAEIVRQLLVRRRRVADLDRLTDRERDVLKLMAEGRSNAGIARQLHISVKTVERHVATVFAELGLAESADDNRRVLAVLAVLRSRH